MILDILIKISTNCPEVEHALVYTGLPQWAIIGGLLPGMFAKESEQNSKCARYAVIC